MLRRRQGTNEPRQDPPWLLRRSLLVALGAGAVLAVSGFEPVFSIAGVTSDAPRGHSRMRMAMEAHEEDFRRLGLIDEEPRHRTRRAPDQAPRCCVCAKKPAKPIDRIAVRPTVAGFIRFVCVDC